MKTEDLVRLLAADNTGAAAASLKDRQMVVAALALALALTVAGFVMLIGLRHDIGDAMAATARKELATFAVLAAGLLALNRLSRPEGMRFRGWVVPMAIIAVLAAWELTSSGTGGWQQRMIGRNNLVCLVTVPLLSLPMLFALLAVMQQRAPRSGAVTGAACGLAAAGLAASLYALHCTDDSLLFVSLWYSIAIMLVAAAGAVLGRRLLRW